MIIGYLVLGWISGALASGLYLVVGEGSWLAVLGVFVGVGNLTVLALVGAALLRIAVCGSAGHRDLSPGLSAASVSDAALGPPRHGA
jgi:hypothetical protein